MTRICCLLLFAGCLATPTPATADPPATVPLASRDSLGMGAMKGAMCLSGMCMASSIRVATYNVNFGLAGDPDGVAAIDALGADVVVLEETNDGWRDAIEAHTAFAHRRFGAPRSWPASGLGVLSRWPIRSIDATPGAPFDAWRIVIDRPEGAFQILAVHLRPPISDGGSWLAGWWSTRPIRERELTDHLAAIDATLPTIVAGDFNEDLSGLAVALLERQHFVDAVARPTEPTWHWPLGGSEIKLALDHVFVDRRFRPVRSGIEHLGHSDHWPVWVELVPAAP